MFCGSWPALIPVGGAEYALEVPVILFIDQVCTQRALAVGVFASVAPTSTLPSPHWPCCRSFLPRQRAEVWDLEFRSVVLPPDSRCCRRPRCIVAAPRMAERKLTTAAAPLPFDPPGPFRTWPRGACSPRQEDCRCRGDASGQRSPMPWGARRGPWGPGARVGDEECRLAD